MRCVWIVAMVACGGAAEEAKAPAATVVVAPAPHATATAGSGGGPSASPDVVVCSPTRTTDALDREALSQALGEASAHLESCAFPQGPRGPGQVRIELDPTGCVASAVVETPRFHQTNAAACIEDLFRHVVIPPFAPEGRPVRITHTFVLR
jgi:hypothetical protein